MDIEVNKIINYKPERVSVNLLAHKYLSVETKEYCFYLTLKDKVIELLVCANVTDPILVDDEIYTIIYKKEYPINNIIRACKDYLKEIKSKAPFVA